MNNLFLTPKDIHDKTFKRSFKGYDENEVDEFLDLIIKEFNIMIDENERLRQELMAKPIVQEYGSASTGEIKRLESMLAQAIEALQKNKQANALSEEQYNAKKAEEYAKEQEKNARLNGFKKSLESYKSNFETLMEEQKKHLNDKYSEMISEISLLTGEKTDAPEDEDYNQLLEYTAPPAPSVVNEIKEQPPPPAADKPPVLYHNENPAGMIEKTILTIEKQTQPEQARQPLYTPEPVAQTPQYAPPKPAMPKAAVYAGASHSNAAVRAAGASHSKTALYAGTSRSNAAVRAAGAFHPKAAVLPERAATGAAAAAGAASADGTAQISGHCHKQSPADPNEQNPVASDNRFKPNYSEYAWLYQERDGLNKAADTNMDISFRNPREKEELKRLIDEVID